MALPTVAATQADITALYGVLAERKTLPRGRVAVAAMNEMIQAINEAYVPQYTVTATDGAAMGADDAALIATGGLYAAKGDVAGIAGDIFTVNSTADTTDNALATAGGGAASDIYQVDAGAATVTYLGTSLTPVETDDESVNDFAVKAGS